MNLDQTRRRAGIRQGDRKWFKAAYEAFEALCDEGCEEWFNKYVQQDSPIIYEKCVIRPIRTPEQFAQVLLVLEVILHGRHSCGERDAYYGSADPAHPYGFNEEWWIYHTVSGGDSTGSLLGAALGYPGLNGLIGSSRLMELLGDYADDRVKWADIIQPLLEALERAPAAPASPSR